MRYGDTWPVSQQAGGPGVTITPARPMRDRHERLLAYEVWKLQQEITRALATPEPVDGAR